MRARNTSGTEATAGCLAVGCVLVIQIAFVVTLVVAVILAARWALGAHGFGL